MDKKKDNPYITKTEDKGLVITEAGKEYLSESVTNIESNVYSFHDKFSPLIIAAAMARLSRFGGDMRELLLKEFVSKKDQESAILRRVLTQFGDDSVQQLSYIPVVVENASILLTKQLEWGRLAAYLEQSTRYIYYDTKRNGRYRYHIPDNFSGDIKDQYTKSMDKIFDIYSKIVRSMTEYFKSTDPTPENERDAAWRIAIRGKACDAARGLLPVSTTSTVGIVGSGQAIDNLIMNLLSQDVPEFQKVGKQILEEVRKQYSIFFERTDMEGRGVATVNYKNQTNQRLKTLALQKLTSDKPRSASKATVKLLEVTPKNELELLAYMFHSQSNMSFAQIKSEISKWSNEEKEAAFSLYIGERNNRRHKPSRALEMAHYTFELVCDYGIFRDLQRHRMVDALEWQLLSPYLGYDIPEAVQKAGLSKDYKKAHKISEELYKKLLDTNNPLQAQYATLLNHRMRWKITLNARAAFHFMELRTQPAGHIGYRKLTKLMHDEIAKVHPRLAKAMIFVNRNDDDPATSRLEQNRAAQNKLKVLGLDGLIE